MIFEMNVSKFLCKIEAGDIDSIVHQLLVKPAQLPSFIWTMNLSHFREVISDPSAFNFLENGSLIVADGWPVKYLAKSFVGRFVHRVPGVDLVDRLLGSEVEFCVIGSDRAQVLKALKNHENAKSALKFIYDEDLDINSEIQIDEIIHLLTKFNPKYVFLALGFPKQEFLFEKIRSKNPRIPAYFLGIGGSFQMLSGEKNRAPRIMQNIGLEWLWRLSQDPKRLFARYYADGKFFVSLVLKMRVKRAQKFLLKKKG
jgi:N-acetylglucosaminyldiphosphoundecaprenol N-acetyl-beta-D-mannosaminyltransferase